VYEPFSGSGTTLIAAQAIGRIFLGVELDPLFVDVAIRRWQAFTGQVATRESDHLTFDQVAADASARTEVPTPSRDLPEEAPDARS
jgi:hypothetical protein